MSRRGFTLLELVVVLAITMLLTGLLFPALLGLREHTNRMISASNMRQIGMGLTMYSTDHSHRLPYSALLRTGEARHMQEMMTLRLNRDGSRLPDLPPGIPVTRGDWDGLGLLYSFQYLGVGKVFYCPSHSGEYPWERYAQRFLDKAGPIIGNYHYRGDLDVTSNGVLLTLDRDSRKTFLTDGLRTQNDVNHTDGYNLLRGDISVNWFVDRTNALRNMLPDETLQTGGEIYIDIWQAFDQMD